MSQTLKSQNSILNMLQETKDKKFKENEWGKRHVRAFKSGQDGLGGAYVEMLKGWARYADAHRSRYESGVSECAYTGEEWERIGRSLLGLLSCEIGNLDGGTMDGLIREILTNEEFDADA